MIALAAALLVAPTGAIFAKGGAIGLVPPPSMRVATFAGFEDPASGASITLAELPPQAYSELVARLDRGGALTGGPTLTGPPEAVTLADGTPARLYRGTQAAHGLRYAKWLLVANGAAVSAIVTAQVPDAAADAARPAIEATLRSVTLRPAPGLDAQIDALPFTIGDRAGFRAIRTMMGSTLVLTDSAGDGGPATAGQPLVIVAHSIGDVQATDREATARKLLQGLAGITDVVIAPAAPSADNIVYRSTATGLDHGTPVVLTQHVRFGPEGGYIRTVCIARPALAAAIAPRCDRLAASVASSGE